MSTDFVSEPIRENDALFIIEPSIEINDIVRDLKRIKNKGTAIVFVMSVLNLELLMIANEFFHINIHNVSSDEYSANLFDFRCKDIFISALCT